MDYRIERKAAFTVLASCRVFSYEGAKEAVPMFWQEHHMSGGGQTVMGVYGINIDETMQMDTFEYLIADPCEADFHAPEGYEVRSIPALTWAVFPIRGAMPDALQDVNTRIYTEWLPAAGNYKFAAGYCVELYDNPMNYPKGTQDENYYCEIWIPVQPK